MMTLFIKTMFTDGPFEDSREKIIEMLGCDVEIAPFIQTGNGWWNLTVVCTNEEAAFIGLRCQVLDGEEVDES